MLANVEQMSYCNHQFDTQANEVINQAIANVAPKSVCYSGMVLLTSRVALVIGIQNMGHMELFNDLFNSLGITVGGELIKFLGGKGKKRMEEVVPKAMRCQGYKIKGTKKTARGICQKDR
jgi:hypothetical protein